MPKHLRTVRVQPIQGEALRYRVESWSDPKHPHLVDLTENDGHGECDCKDFVTRKGPALRDGGAPHSPETECRHIVAAKRHFLKHTLADMAEHLNGRPKHRSPFPAGSTSARNHHGRT